MWPWANHWTLLSFLIVRGDGSHAVLLGRAVTKMKSVCEVLAQNQMSVPDGCLAHSETSCDRSHSCAIPSALDSRAIPLCVLIQSMSVSSTEQALILFSFCRGRRWKHLAQSHSASGRAGTWPRMFTWECRLTPTTLSHLNTEFLCRQVGSTGVSCCLLWWWWHFPGL